jgi:hypothetical protein
VAWHLGTGYDGRRLLLRAALCDGTEPGSCHSDRRGDGETIDLGNGPRTVEGNAKRAAP